MNYSFKKNFRTEKLGNFSKIFYFIFLIGIITTILEVLAVLLLGTSKNFGQFCVRAEILNTIFTISNIVYYLLILYVGFFIAQKALYLNQVIKENIFTIPIFPSIISSLILTLIITIKPLLYYIFFPDNIFKQILGIAFSLIFALAPGSVIILFFLLLILNFLYYTFIILLISFILIIILKFIKYEAKVTMNKEEDFQTIPKRHEEKEESNKDLKENKGKENDYDDMNPSL